MFIYLFKYFVIFYNYLHIKYNNIKCYIKYYSINYITDDSICVLQLLATLKLASAIFLSNFYFFHQMITLEKL